MITKALPTYTVQELNEAIGLLLDRGFAPRFILNATASSCQLKKGHLWITLTDGEASITAVVWSSQLKKISYKPNNDDGVVIVGRLNFWQSRATLVVQILDIRPSMSTVLRKFEVVSSLLKAEGIIDESKIRTLPTYPQCIAILTSIPSSALADILRTAKERWPLTKLILIPIPVQGHVSKEVQAVLKNIANNYKSWKIDALVLARGGGNREDLTLFDDEDVCRELAAFPFPVVTGIGHEDDLTVADLVADYRAATPTAAIIALLPSINFAQETCLQKRDRLNSMVSSYINNEKQKMLHKRNILNTVKPSLLIQLEKNKIAAKRLLLKSASPARILEKGFALLFDDLGNPIRSITDLSVNDNLIIQLVDGTIKSAVSEIDLQREYNDEE